MKASQVLAALVVVAGSVLPFHSRAQEGTDPASRQVQLKKGDRIIFFGDSLTALAIKDANVPEGKGYVPLVRAVEDREVDVDAVATGGHKVTDLLKRVDQDVLAKKPTIVVIQIGSMTPARVTPELFEAQLKELIGKLRQGGARVIQCTCTCRIEGYNPENAMDKNWMPWPRWLALWPGRNSFPSSIFAKHSSITGKRTTPRTNPTEFSPTMAITGRRPATNTSPNKC
jgi:lysophospholipase L1-like esterase